eukprot:1992706-Pyramimonas_sp.AAC.1
MYSGRMCSARPCAVRVTALTAACAFSVTFGGNISRMNQRSAVVREEWKKLVADVRGVFSSRITYAANFDEYSEVDWWQHLDMIGINAYFPLRSVCTSFHPHPTTRACY